MMKVILVLLVLLCGNEAAKIMLLPMNMGSHLLFFGQTGSALAEEGHEVVMYVPSNNKPPKGLSDKLRFVIFQVNSDIPVVNTEAVTEMETRMVQAESSFEWVPIFLEWVTYLQASWNEECGNLHEMYDQIKSEGFDLAIMDMALFSCQYTVPYKLGIPHITLSVPSAPWIYRVPHLSSQCPTPAVTYSDSMDFWQRLHVFLMDVTQMATMSNSDFYSRQFVPEREPIGATDLIAKSAMWWYLYDISVGYPKVSMPNTINIGDMMARPALPLPKEYEDIVNSSPQGVILVSLGSHFDHVPEAWSRRLCEAFNSVKYTVIWKNSFNPPCDLGPNVHVKKWVPQNDLLAHPNLKLFITHCGINSVIESVHHRTPMIGFPITNDQPYNAGIVESKGYGKILKLQSFTSEEVTEAIDEVIGSDKYHKNVQLGSKILQSQLESPGKRMSFWVNYILTHGHSHLRTKAHELNLFQFLMIDIFLFLLLCAVCLIITVIVCCICCVRCCKKCFVKQSVKVKTQ